MSVGSLDGAGVCAKAVTAGRMTSAADRAVRRMVWRLGSPLVEIRRDGARRASRLAHFRLCQDASRPEGGDMGGDMTAGLDRDRIAAVYERIRPYVRVTPVVVIDGANFGLPAFPLTLKLELMQHAGSFKTRGAFTHLLTRDVPAAGVVAASGGNHGAAVAYAAMKRRVPARFFVPTVSSPAKIDRIRACGAELTVIGERYAEALAASELWVTESGAMAVHAFDQ